MKQQQLKNQNLENENSTQNKQEDLKECDSCNKNIESCSKTDNKSKNQKGKKYNKNIGYMNYKKNKCIHNKENQKKINKSPGEKLANTLEKLGKVSGPVISNVTNDRGKLWEYPAPYNH